MNVLLQYSCFNKKQMDYKDEKHIRNEDLFQVTSEQMSSIIHRSIGAITFLNPVKLMEVGSGVAISRDLVLTVAHNVYNKKYAGQNDSLKFYLKDGEVAEKYYDIESCRFLPQFKDCPSDARIKFDYALLKLKSPLPFDKYIPLSEVCEHCLMEMNFQTILQIFGYPGNYRDNYKPLDRFGERFILEQYGMAKKGRILSIRPQLFSISYAVGTLEGQSGAPAWIDSKIIAVHCGHGNQGEQLNVGRLITSDMLINLQLWRQQLNASPFQKKPSKFCPYSQRKITNQDIQRFIKQDQSKQYQQVRLIILQKDQIIRNLQRLLGESNNANSHLLQENKKMAETIEELRLKLTQTLLKTATSIEQRLQLSQAKTEESSPFTQQQLQFSQSDSSSDFEQASMVSEFPQYIKHYIPLKIRNQLKNSIKEESLDLSERKLSHIDLSWHSKLKTLSLYNNQLKHLDLSQNTRLQMLALDTNHIAHINLQKNTCLMHINLSNNRLQYIDLMFCTKLKSIQLDHNALRKVRLFWTSQIDLIHLDNQQSDSCKAYLIYRDDSEKCMKWGRDYIEAYNLYDNSHGCKYSFGARQHESL